MLVKTKIYLTETSHKTKRQETQVDKKEILPKKSKLEMMGKRLRVKARKEMRVGDQ